jgi:tRNASer (uridine44-2'-O)-methyltransferase
MSIRRAIRLNMYKKDLGTAGPALQVDSLTWGIVFPLDDEARLTGMCSCGNGLLTHILTSEGYSGHGIDVRARTSWQHYPETTQAQLHVHAFDPTDPVSVDGAFFRPGAFIIGNHSDELTPWIPVLSTLHDACGYLSIPCCAWDFDVKFERAGTHKYPIPSEEWVDALNLGGEGSKSSSYSIYRIWLASLSLHCGWEVECETLRIPSTRNWAIIGAGTRHSSRFSLIDLRSGAGRKRVVKDGEEAAREIVDRVRLRGIFKTRKPEGKHSEH